MENNEQHTCSFCGSSNVYGMSRVVGYYSIINNWNLGKQKEFEARQKGNYILDDKIIARLGKEK